MAEDTSREEYEGGAVGSDSFSASSSLHDVAPELSSSKAPVPSAEYASTQAAAMAPPAQRTAPPVTVVDPVTGAKVVMTKSAAKKAARRALREQKKAATKHERRARDRARRKERRQLARAEREKNPEPPSPPRPPAHPFDARVVVDLGFDDLMTADEATSLAAQLGYLYGVNRSSSHPFSEILFTGAGRISGRSLGFAPPHGAAYTFPETSTSESSLFEDRVGQHMELKNRGSWRRWRHVSLIERGGLEALWESGRIDKNDVVYLTADTDCTIEALEPGKTYVIGGIVDRNRYKHLCAKKAEALGLPVARLPIDPAFLDGQRMNARKVLTVNQVFAILAGWSETRNWTEALKRGLPTRKFNDGAASALENEYAPSDGDVAVDALHADGDESHGELTSTNAVTLTNPGSSDPMHSLVTHTPVLAGARTTTLPR